MPRVTAVEHRSSYVVVALDDSGLLDGSGDLRSRLREVLGDGAATVLVDVSRLERLTSEDVAALLWARRECQARGGRVVLCAANRRSQAMLARAELTRLFDIDTAQTPASPWRHP
jgi:ABC-type transporter Mla MlaB component